MSTSLPGSMVRAMRPKQWTKNALVLAAFIFALGDRQQQIDKSLFFQALEAMLIFCAVSSGIYLVNDLKDRELDRAHPVKKNRPIASGALSPGVAWLMALILLGGGQLIACTVSKPFGVVIASYVLLQLAYCYFLKRLALMDIFIIATGFVLRALAGAVAISVIISPWLLLCTFFLALFIALCKRRHEKVVVESDATIRQNLKDYSERLLDQLIGIMAAATIVAYSLYTLWPETVEKFNTHGLVFTVPFVVFGIFRYLDLVYRHDMGGRPEQILLTDPPLMACLILYGMAVITIFLVGIPGF